MTQVALDHGTPLVLVAPGGHGESEFDRRRISRVVRNLIGNAIEHGEGKPIVVRVDSNETAVAISVRDYGVGMSSKQLERSFDRFWRADPSRKRTMGGSGLGLAISNEDALLHEGRLEVWSELGKGANFRLTLPRHVGGEILLSPLQLEPADAGAEEPALEAAPLEDEAFADEDVDTQPLTLPRPGDRGQTTESIDLPSITGGELPTVGGDEPPHEHPAPWAEGGEVVEVVVEQHGDGRDAAGRVPEVGDGIQGGDRHADETGGGGDTAPGKAEEDER
ncbi:MAG: ATP-binding protein [Pseudoclavibacter sp.]